MKDEKLKVLFRDEEECEDAWEDEWDYNSYDPLEEALNDAIADDDIDIYDSEMKPIDPSKYYNNEEDPRYNYMDMDRSLYECHVPICAGDVQFYNYRVRKDPRLTERDLLIGVRRDGSIIEEKGDDYYGL